MAIRYSRVQLNETCKGTVYSENKGNKIIRKGDTLIVTHNGFSRTIHVPWVAVAEADFAEEIPNA